MSTQEAPNDIGKCLPAIIETKEFVKDPYVLEFLDLPENIEGKESVLETALINNLQKFLLELGKGFSLVARQFRISTETDHFYADLVFYNYILKMFCCNRCKNYKANQLRMLYGENGIMKTLYLFKKQENLCTLTA